MCLDDAPAHEAHDDLRFIGRRSTSSVRPHHDDGAMDESDDARIGTLAAAQHGLVSAQQASASGLSATQMRGRVLSGRWERIGRGVYRIRGAPVTPLQPAMAAVLARPDGAISFLNAAQVIGLTVAGPPKPWLTVPASSSARSPLARIHRSDLPQDQVVVVQGIRVTTAARTLVDCSSLFGAKRLGKLVDEAMHRRLTTPAQVEVIIDAHRDPRRAAAHAVLRGLVEVWRPAIRPGSPA
ncbi:MAG: type IV toxin-antitoxin system AbiEi family antitoxin domain-containing protein [Aquihabitans sp.]